MAVASALSKAGHEIIILNRDIKFGGLAEYGIFPSKLKLRGGLKKQYWELLQQKNIHYFGNVSIGNGKDLSVEDVRGLGASAVVFTIGAQGTKAIGVDGDSAQGVFHAKDVVYHFNRLPGFGPAAAKASEIPSPVVRRRLWMNNRSRTRRPASRSGRAARQA